MEKIKYTGRDRLFGILYILGAGFGFACMSFMVRLSGELPVFEKVFFRNIVAAMIIFVAMKKKNIKFEVAAENRLFLFLRALFGTIGLICNFYAIDHMNIADASMLNKLSPFFVVIASSIFLKENPKPTDWVFTAIAFIGAGFVVKPSFSYAVLPALFGIMGGIMAGAAYTVVRIIGNRGVKAEIIIFTFSSFSTLITLPLLILQYKPMQLWQLACLLCAGFFAMLGQVCITRAYTYAPAKEIGVFDYSQVLYAAFLGYIFLHQMPDIYSVAGYILIIGAGAVKCFIPDKDLAVVKQN